MILVTLFPLLLGLCLCYGTNGELPSVDTMKSGVENFAELYSGLKDAKPKQIINSVGSLLTMVPAPAFRMLGLSLLLFSALIDDSTPKPVTQPTPVVDNTEVLAKLDQIKGSVLTLMRSVEKMGQQLESKISEQTVLEKERSILVLSGIFVKLQKTRRRFYWDTMKHSCIRNDFFGLPGFFRDELIGTAPTSSGFIKGLGENHEFTKYERGIHRLIGGFYTASLMHAACTVITSEANNVPALIANIEDIDKLVGNINDDSDFNLESGSILETIVEENKELLNDMIKEINASVVAVRQDFEKNSFTWAKHWVVKEGTFMNETNETNNTKIAESLYSQLNEKYPWRPWMVAVYNHKGTPWKAESLPQKDESKRTKHCSSAFQAFVIGNKMIAITSVEVEEITLEERTWKGNVKACDESFQNLDFEKRYGFWYILKKGWRFVRQKLGECVGKHFGYLYSMESGEPELVVKTSKEMERFVYHNTFNYGTDHLKGSAKGTDRAVFIFTY